MRRLLLTTLILTFGSVSSATVINIPADYPTIQQGINASIDGDTVLVQPGSYVENINFNGHNIVLGSLFLTSGDTSHIAATIIDGDSAGSVVTLTSGESNAAVITGFTVTKGWGINTGPNATGGGFTCKANSNPVINRNNIILNNAIQGSGIYIYEAEPVITGNLFFADTSDFDGGAIACRFTDALIDGNVFLENFGDCGGAVFCGNASPTIINNIMINNYAIVLGGAIGCRYGSYPIISFNTIVENVADAGGGIGCTGSDAFISNNIIRSNRTSYEGAGISCNYADSFTIINNTVVYNAVYDNYRYGGGLYCNNSVVNVINTIFWGDSASIPYKEIYTSGSVLDISYSNIEDTVWSGIGNISIDPLFRDPTNGDFHLMSIACDDSADSPCIDAGHPDSIDFVLGCLLGLGDQRSDMGAYGGDNGDWQTDIISHDDDPGFLPGTFFGLQNYPNPFNASTTIRFVIPESQYVKLTVYDLLGRQVEKLLDDYRHAGVHTVTFDASRFSSGVYFYRLQAGERVETKRMVLLK